MLFLLIGALAAPSRADKPYVNLDCQKNTSTYAHSGASEKDGATQSKSGVNICRMRRVRNGKRRREPTASRFGLLLSMALAGSRATLIAQIEVYLLCHKKKALW